MLLEVAWVGRVVEVAAVGEGEIIAVGGRLPDGRFARVICLELKPDHPFVGEPTRIRSVDDAANSLRGRDAVERVSADRVFPREPQDRLPGFQRVPDELIAREDPDAFGQAAERVVHRIGVDGGFLQRKPWAWDDAPIGPVPVPDLLRSLLLQPAPVDRASLRCRHPKERVGVRGVRLVRVEFRRLNGQRPGPSGERQGSPKAGPDDGRGEWSRQPVNRLRHAINRRGCHGCNHLVVLVQDLDDDGSGNTLGTDEDGVEDVPLGKRVAGRVRRAARLIPAPSERRVRRRDLVANLLPSVRSERILAGEEPLEIEGVPVPSALPLRLGATEILHECVHGAVELPSNVALQGAAAGVRALDPLAAPIVVRIPVVQDHDVEVRQAQDVAHVRRFLWA